MKYNLTNFVKYCLGYVKLTRKRSFASRDRDVDFIKLSNKRLDLSQIILHDLDDENISKKNSGLIHFDVFYKYYPKEVPDNKLAKYEKEKAIAQKIEDLCNKYRIDPYTKQILLQFGCFEIELPIEGCVAESDASANGQISNQFKIDHYCLFSLPVKIEKKIEKDIGKYFIYPADTEVQVDIEMLESVLGEDLYFQIISKIGRYEIEGKFTLPIANLDIFQEIWDTIKAQLRLKNVNFNEQSFDLENINLVFGPRSNYFLSEDLAKLSKLTEEDLEHTALTGWSQAHDLNIKTEMPDEKQLFFPFPYDRYQHETLSLLKNKCAIIQGPPGTGKSTTIANILCHLAANGNRVLFVSQKAQALKVVKDKLKKLDIKYLFSYIPNPSSAQLGEEDEADGIAPQLSSLGGYIERLKDRVNCRRKSLFLFSSGMGKVVEDKIQTRQFLNKSIENQRKYFVLEQEHLAIKEYDIQLEDRDKFKINASVERLQELSFLNQKIIKLENDLKEMEESKFQNKDLFDKVFCNLTAGQPYSEIILQLGKQVKNVYSSIEKIRLEMLILRKKVDQYDLMLDNDSNYSKQKIAFDQDFNRLNLCDITYLKEIGQLKEDLLKTAYDGHSSIFRYVNNAKRRIRLAGTFSSLPRDLRDYVNDFLSRNISKIEILELINCIENYFCYLDQNKQLIKKQKEIIIILSDQLQVFKNSLPIGIISLIEEKICRFDFDYVEADNIFSSLFVCFKYQETALELRLAQSKFDDVLRDCGISRESFFVMEQKINNFNSASCTEIINKILKAIQLNEKIKELNNHINTQYNISDQTSLEKERVKCISTYIQNLIDEKILDKWEGNSSVKQTVRKLAGAFGKSKHAFKTFDTLRKTPDNFKEILNIIPIWIMELDDASRIIPLESNLFDYVILDEASQCNIAYALPVMYRTAKVLFVGDSEQMRDGTVAFKSNRDFDELAHRFQIPEEKRIKTTGASVQSVLDIAYKKGFTEKTLRQHYRSPVELIGFCNEYFYKPKGKELIVVNNNYLTYKNTNRTMLIHEVQSDWQNEKDDQINVAEAEFILKLFKDLRSDEKYKNKSIGILSFFSKQACHIRKLFEDAGLKEVEDNYKICNIEGVQGDEKDIVIYSFVIRKPDQKNKYTPLTGEGGDIRGDVNMGRVNVAFSRARDQVHCCISLPVAEVPDKIWIKKYLEYVEENGLVKHNATELKPFDSYFEESFYNIVHTKLNHDYIIQNQVASCGFKIDFVITNIKTGKRIAIECDGPCHFQDETCDLYIESDEERQKILETAGWKFYRIRYSDWVNRGFDYSKTVQDIISLLN